MCVAEQFTPSFLTMSTLTDLREFSTPKKLKRLESKKRKIKAFLKIAQINEEDRRKADMKRRNSSGETEVTLQDPSKPKRMRHEGTQVSPPDNCFPCSPRAPTNGAVGEVFIPVSRPSLTPDELAALRIQIRERQKVKLQKPVFYLAQAGSEAEFKEFRPTTSPAKPIFLQDVQHLLLCSLIGDLAPYKPRWCKLVRWYKISHVVALVVEGASVKNYVEHKPELVRMAQIFDTIVEVLPPAQYNCSVAEELLCVALSASAQQKMEKRQKMGSAAYDATSIPVAFRSFFPIQPVMSSPLKSPSGMRDMFSRTLLLLDPRMMMMENYPLPAKEENYRDYVFTKDVYENVSAQSPLFAIDCEMCLTEQKVLELTRVTIVNEHLEVIYDTLVKPHNRIVNYMTRFSGITANMLRNVTTNLEEVQQKVRSMLPADAILCGQSLNADLHVLKMMHPYVIDTSVIYNLSGLRYRKPSLKLLSQLFLNSEIQSSRSGHSSIEDSIATMRLVQHKLQHTVAYGDLVMGGLPPFPTTLQPEVPITDFVPCPVQNGPGLVTSFFNHLKDKNKTVALVGSADAICQFSLEEVGFHHSDNVDHYVCAGNKEVAQHLKEKPVEYSFTLAHMDLQRLEQEPDRQQSIFYKLDQRIAKTYKALYTNALFVVIFSGSSTPNDTGQYHNGLCMVKVKS